jgi:hypothetical protein
VTDVAVPSPERAWWRRVRLVLQSPSSVFAALRDESEADASARAEPVLAIVLLAGMATVLSSSAAAHLLDDPEVDWVLVAVWAFLGGGLYGALLYWLGGLLLHFGITALGSNARYRRSRQLLAFAAVPIAASLVLWVPRLVLFGGDSFRYAGSDDGAGSAVFGLLQVAISLWALALLVVGVRAVERWSWGRALAAVAVGAFIPVLVTLAAVGVV